MTRDFATRCFQQIEGFGTYGFPESHAASFALLVYVSAWIKCHYPDVFAAALLNSQPMGFYAPAQIVRDAREHGVTVREVDVNASEWHCTLEEMEAAPADENLARCALRLGFRQIKGFSEDDAKALVKDRAPGYATPRELWRRAGMKAGALEKLAQADAFRSLGLDRRQALWALKGLGAPPLPLFAAAPERPLPAVPEAALPEMTLGEHVAEDYVALRLSLKRHPVAFLRDELRSQGMVRAVELAEIPVNHRVTIAGLVVTRQRPGTASGVIFVTLEDETGIANLIVWPAIFEAHRRTVLGARLIGCTGRLQREGLVIHVVAERLVDLTPRLRRLRDGPIPPLQHGHGDEATHPPPLRPKQSPDLVIPSRDFH